MTVVFGLKKKMLLGILEISLFMTYFMTVNIFYHFFISIISVHMYNLFIIHFITVSKSP